MTRVLTFDDVAISLNGQELLRINTDVAAGHVLSIMGPSGSGKSSLLAFIAGFLDPAFVASGQILLNGERLDNKPPHQRRVGILFQDPLLFPHMSVGGNLLFALPADVTGTERRERVEAGLQRVGLDGYFDRDPDTLSGGQKARVALMRVLMSRPMTLLLDEPFSKLDTSLRQQMRELVFSEAKSEGLPIVLVTHDREDVVAAGGVTIELESE